MKTQFIKSLATGLALVTLTSACSMFGTKEAAHKCGGKNSCKANATNATEVAPAKTGVNKCSSNKCSSTNKCSAKK